MTDTPIQAIYRPAAGDIRTIWPDSDIRDLSIDQAEDLRDALTAALGMPALARGIADAPAESAWTTR